MSHEEYTAACSEDQLVSLVEWANIRLKKIRSSGFINLWVVSIGWGNVAWFAESDYVAAIDYACKAVKAKSMKLGSKGVEMEVKLDQFRPDEVAELLAVAAPSPKDHT